jgi:hypothetical protein
MVVYFKKKIVRIPLGYSEKSLEDTMALSLFLN